MLALEGAEELERSPPPRALAIGTSLVSLRRRNAQDRRKFGLVLVLQPVWIRIATHAQRGHKSSVYLCRSDTGNSRVARFAAATIGARWFSSLLLAGPPSLARQASANCCWASSRVVAQPTRGLSSGSMSTQLIDQNQRSPAVSPVCRLSDPTTVPPLIMTRCSLLGSQQARGNCSAALRRRWGMAPD